MAVVREITASSAVVAGVSATNYAAIADTLQIFATTETFEQITFRAGGVLSNLYTRVTANTITATSTVRTRKAAGNGAEAVSIGSSATGEFQDLSNTDTVTAADKWNYQLVTGGTGTGISISIIAANFAATTSTVKQFLTVSSLTSTSASTTAYTGYSGNAASFADTTENDVKFTSRIAGTSADLFVNVTSNARTTTTTFNSRKNTANGNLTLSVGSAATGIFEDTTHSDTVAPGDLINFSTTTGTGAGSLAFNIGAEFTSTASQFFFISSIVALSVSANTTRFSALGGSLPSTITNEPDAQSPITFPFIASNLFVRVRTNTVSAASTIKLRQNSADTTLATSITASTTGVFEDTTDTVNVAPTDEINYSVAAGATGTTLGLTIIAITATQFILSVSDNTAVSDTPTILILSGNLNVSTSDSTVVSDTPRIEVISFINLTDSTAISEFVGYYQDSAFVWDTPTITIATNTSLNVIASDSTAVIDTPAVELISYINLADSSATTDIPSIEQFSYINVTDSSTVSDTPTVEAISYISVSDSTAVSEAPALQIISYANITDTSAVSDTPTIETIEQGVSITDTTAVSDTPAFEVISYINLTDTTAVSDTPLVFIQGGVFVTDTTAVSDTATVSIQIAVPATDSTAVSDIPTAELVSFITPSDTTAVSDTPTIETTSTASVTDTSAVSDTVTLRLFSNINVNDTTAVTATPTVSVQVLVSVSDSTAVSDTNTVAEINLINTADSTATTDSPIIEEILLVSLTESTAVSDAPSFLIGIAAVVSDSTAVSDIASLSLTVPLTIAVFDTTAVSDAAGRYDDVAVMSDTFTPSIQNYVSVSDSSAVQDTPTIQTILPVLATDTTTVTDVAGRPDDTAYAFDSASTQLTSFISISDTTAILEAVALGEGGINTLASDTTAMSELVTLAFISNLAVSDTTTVTDLAGRPGDTLFMQDSFTPTLQNFISVSDLTAISDAPSLLVVNPFLVSDTTTVSDTVGRPDDTAYIFDTPTLNIPPVPPLTLSVLDSTAVSDTPKTLIPTQLLSVSDSTAVSDTPTVRTVLFITAGDSTLVSDGDSRSLDGTTGFASTNNFTQFGISAITAMIWLKTTSTGAVSSLIGVNAIAHPLEFELLKNTNYFFQFINTSGVTISSSAVPAASVEDGNWHNLAATFDGTALIIYLDGIQQGPTVTTNHPIQNFFPRPLGIGIREENLSAPFAGLLSDVRVYNAARTQAQIQADFRKRLVGNEAGLTFYAPLNTTLNDLTSNVNNLLVAEGANVPTPDVPSGLGVIVLLPYLTVSVGDTTHVTDSASPEAILLMSVSDTTAVTEFVKLRAYRLVYSDLFVVQTGWPQESMIVQTAWQQDYMSIQTGWTQESVIITAN